STYTSSFIHSVFRTCHSFPFFFNHTATTEIYPLSLHDALPILAPPSPEEPTSTTAKRESNAMVTSAAFPKRETPSMPTRFAMVRSEEHTSELQSRGHLVCRLLLEKKKKNKNK